MRMYATLGVLLVCLLAGCGGSEPTGHKAVARHSAPTARLCSTLAHSDWRVTPYFYPATDAENGTSLDCVFTEPDGDRVDLYIRVAAVGLIASDYARAQKDARTDGTVGPSPRQRSIEGWWVPTHRGPESGRHVLKNVAIAVVLLLILLLAVGLLGGVGTVELLIWLVLAIVVLTVTVIRTRRSAG